MPTLVTYFSTQSGLNWGPNSKLLFLNELRNIANSLDLTRVDFWFNICVISVEKHPYLLGEVEILDANDFFAFINIIL